MALFGYNKSIHSTVKFPPIEIIYKQQSLYIPKDFTKNKIIEDFVAGHVKNYK